MPSVGVRIAAHFSCVSLDLEVEEPRNSPCVEPIRFHDLGHVAQGFVLIYEQLFDRTFVLLPRTRRYSWRIGFGVSRHCRKTISTG